MYIYVKRLADVVLAVVGLVICLPLFLVVAVIIKLDSRGPVFYKHLRYGKHKKPFMLYKFRSMTTDAPNKATNEFHDSVSYITRSGKILRKTSVDELPQLINILKGDMSFVGPRPVILAEKRLIDLRENYSVNDVRPGITGWAQANGRDELDDETKAAMDGFYISNFGFVMDLRSILHTFQTVLGGKGYNEQVASSAKSPPSSPGEADEE